MTTETLTFDTITEKLDEGGVQYTHSDRGTDREAIGIPGYGEVRYDAELGEWYTTDHKCTVNPETSIDEAELLADLEELGAMAEAIR